MTADIEAAAKAAIDECPKCQHLQGDARAARIREVVADVEASRARAAARGDKPAPAVMPEKRTPPVRREPIAARTSPNPERTRTRATERARDEPDWTPGERSSRLCLLGWLDAHAPNHSFNDDHSRAQVWREVMKLAA